MPDNELTTSLPEAAEIAVCGTNDGVVAIYRLMEELAERRHVH